MRKGIPITSPQGVQVVSLVFAGVLALSAYFFVTTGWGTPFPGCWPGLSRPVALSVAVLEAMLAFGFVIAALQIPSTPRLKDSLLVTMVLALFASIAVGGGVYTLTTGIARFGRSGCLQVGAPWSYGIATTSLFVGAIALFAAAMTLTGRGRPR